MEVSANLEKLPVYCTDLLLWYIISKLFKSANLTFLVFFYVATDILLL
jgi:hypothetical protein